MNDKGKICGRICVTVIAGAVVAGTVGGLSQAHKYDNWRSCVNKCIDPFKSLAKDNGLDFASSSRYGGRVIGHATARCGDGAENILNEVFPSDIEVTAYTDNGYKLAIKTAQNLTKPSDQQLPCRINITINNKKPVLFDPKAGGRVSNSTSA